ncbi:MAG: hypothetical protein M3347_08240 [Armatimonadota bacterium]|nr:hypothetical protein [Armatimonadota bacterium]
MPCSKNPTSNHSFQRDEPQDNDDVLDADLLEAIEEEIANLKQDTRKILLRRRQLIAWRKGLRNGKHTPPRW